jgi:hypothetical protein
LLERSIADRRNPLRLSDSCSIRDFTMQAIFSRNAILRVPDLIEVRAAGQPQRQDLFVDPSALDARVCLQIFYLEMD